MSESKPLGIYRLASYGAPSMPLSMVALPLAVYLTPVYADSQGFGLSLGFVGLNEFLRNLGLYFFLDSSEESVNLFGSLNFRKLLFC